MIQDTVNALAVPQAREIAGKLAGKILNVLGMDQVGISQVLCPFPCDVLAMYQPGKLVLAPSVMRRFRTEIKEARAQGKGKSANTPDDPE